MAQIDWTELVLQGTPTAYLDTTVDSNLGEVYTLRLDSLSTLNEEIVYYRTQESLDYRFETIMYCNGASPYITLRQNSGGNNYGYYIQRGNANWDLRRSDTGLMDSTNTGSFSASTFYHVRSDIWTQPNGDVEIRAKIVKIIDPSTYNMNSQDFSSPTYSLSATDYNYNSPFIASPNNKIGMGYSSTGANEYAIFVNTKGYQVV